MKKKLSSKKYICQYTPTQFIHQPYHIIKIYTTYYCTGTHRFDEEEDGSINAHIMK
jgi:hypothetical protein